MTTTKGYVVRDAKRSVYQDNWGPHPRRVRDHGWHYFVKDIGLALRVGSLAEAQRFATRTAAIAAVRRFGRQDLMVVLSLAVAERDEAMYGEERAA